MAQKQVSVETQEPQQKTSSQPFLKINDRVFHSKYGIGKITDIKEIGESSMYIIDFGSQGQKALDAAYAQLKKF